MAVIIHTHVLYLMNICLYVYVIWDNRHRKQLHQCKLKVVTTMSVSYVLR